MGRPRKPSDCHLSPANTVTRVIGYVRVSTDDQEAGVEAQRNAITAECTRRGWELVEIIEDAGVSGKRTGKAIKNFETLDRPGIRRAMEAVNNGTAEVLMGAKLDRLSRSVKDFAELLDQALYYGWKLVILDCNVDTSTPSGELLAGVMAQFANFERRMIGVRTREALAVKRSQGIVGGRRKNVPANVLADLQGMRSKGMTYAAMAAKLNENRVPTAQGGKQWHPSTVQRILDQVAA
jgi:DNA invertase Pin-like site-specific DNA recombinase